MEFGIPFDVDPTSAVPDEYEVTAPEERMRIGAKVTDGVYPQVRIVKDNILEPQAYIGESLRVSAGVGLSVAVSAGMACVGSTDYFNTETKVISFEKNNIEQVWDIVVELDLVNQKTLAKKQMRASGMKITDALIRTKHMHQICLATVTIPPNAEEIVTANIEEQRLNTALATDGKPVCGIVGSVMQADTRMISEALNQQIKENDVKFCKALERYNGQIVKNQQDYEEWFTNVKIELGKDVAGNLLNKINEVKDTTYTKTQTETLINKNTGINATATHSSHTVSLTAPPDAVQIIFEAPSNFAEADTYTLNGAPLTLTDLNNEPLSDAWKQGATVPLIIKDGKAFFKGGGGSYGTLSPQIKKFTAKAGNHQITLNWQNPSDANHAGTYIVRKQGSKPTKLSDGTKIDVGKATSYTDNKPENDKLYYYRAFTYNAKKQVQTELTGAVVSAMPVPYKTMTVKINLNESNPSAMCSYADDAVGMVVGSQEWDNFFGHKPCLFKDGAVVGYLNPNDFTKFEDGSNADITSGSAGDAMIEFPRRGLTISTSGDIVTVSMTKAQDSADFEYLAHTRGTTRKDKFYVGAYMSSIFGGYVRSVSGRAIEKNRLIGNWRPNIHLKGSNYDLLAFYQITYLQAMYLLKYKNTDSQTMVGMGAVSMPIGQHLNTGGTESSGMDWGVQSQRSHVKLFGIEDFWGNYNQFIDGTVTNSNTDLLTATNNFNDDGTGYTNLGKVVIGSTSGGYMKKCRGTSNGGFALKESGGSATTYFCDNAGLRPSCVLSYGGKQNSDTAGGIFSMMYIWDKNLTSDSWTARLMYL